MTLFTLSSIFAEDLVDLYKHKGIKEVEKHLDMQLSKKEFWNKKIQNKSTKFGYLQEKKTIIHVNKNKKRLKLYKYHNGKYKTIFEKNFDFTFKIFS